MKQSNTTKHTNRLETISYGGFSIGQSAIMVFVMQFLNYFYTEDAGLKPIAVGTLFLVIRILDAIKDPLLGGIIDQVTPKRGKFKPWLNASILLLPLITWMLFFKVGEGETLSLIYAYGVYGIWCIVFSISDVPIKAIVTTMTDHIEERTFLLSIGNLVATVSMVIVLVFSAPVISNIGYFKTVGILVIFAFVMMVPFAFNVKERFIHIKKETQPIIEMIQTMLKNKYLIAILTANMLIGSFATHQTLGLYFIRYNLGDLSLQGIVMAASLVPMIAIPILAPKLIKRFGKRKLFISGISFSIVMSFLQLIVGYENFILFLVVTALKSVGIFMPMMLTNMFTADCIEYGAYITGQRNEGISFSLQALFSKLTGAFSGYIGMYMLAKIGYSANAVSLSEAFKDKLWYLMVLFPLVGLIAGIFVFVIFYKLEEKEVQKMIMLTKG